MTYIFLDEVQEVPSFEKVVDSLYIRDYVDVYVHDEQAQHLSAAVFLLYKTSLWMTVRFDFELCRFSFYLKL